MVASSHPDFRESRLFDRRQPRDPHEEACPAVTSPASAAARTRRSNGSTTPGPVPQVTWNLGTLLPRPLAW